MTNKNDQTEGAKREALPEETAYDLHELLSGDPDGFDDKQFEWYQKIYNACRTALARAPQPEPVCPCGGTGMVFKAEYADYMACPTCRTQPEQGEDVTQVLPCAIDDEAQTVTLSMAAYSHLIRFHSFGVTHHANVSRAPINKITDMKVLKELHDKAHADHVAAGKAENVTLFNETQDTGRAIYEQMKRLLAVYGLKSLQGTALQADKAGGGVDELLAEIESMRRDLSRHEDLLTRNVDLDDKDYNRDAGWNDCLDRIATLHRTNRLKGTGND